MSADRILYCLEHLTDYRQFERLSSDLMAGNGYPDIEPIGGSGDGGRDAIHQHAGAPGLTVFAYTVRMDWRRKLNGDCARISEVGLNPAKVVFVCTATLSGDEKDEARASIKQRYGWQLDIFDIERIRVLLVGPLRHLVAKHPAIFCPPYFSQRGGLSIAESFDTLIIDHIESDHALATWLSRRLSLEGYQTWCFGTAPLAGEDADSSVRQLIQSRGVKYLPVLSPAAVADRGFMDRCGAAGSREDFVMPCWTSDLQVEFSRGRLAQTVPARFDRGWAVGLAQVLEYLKSSGVPLSDDPARGRAVALRAYMPEPVTKPEPESIFANVFSASVPRSLMLTDLSRPLTDAEIMSLRDKWPFVVSTPLQLLSFDRPPPGRIPFLERSPGESTFTEYAWEQRLSRKGDNTLNVVKDLIRRCLHIACVGAGLKWCDRRELFYYSEEKHGNQRFTHVDGRETRVTLNGERQYGRGERASKFRYQLSPTFGIGRDESAQWWITLRVYVRVTDMAGTPFEEKDIVRRRKAVTKGWWNKEWLARVLGVMQALRNDGTEIVVGTQQHALRVSTTPLQWKCPIAIDYKVLDHIGDFQEEMAEMRAGDEEEGDDDDLVVLAPDAADG